jgi:hypothetical protein
MFASLDAIPETVNVDFVLGGRCQTVKLGKASRVSKLTLDGLNIRHFVNVFCKRNTLAQYPASDEDILKFCVIPADTIGAGQTVWDALNSMSRESLRILGRDYRAVECDRLLALFAAEPSRKGQAAHAQSLMDYLQTAPVLRFIEAHPAFKAVVIAKCKELRALHAAEFPGLAGSCTAVLGLLGVPDSTQVIVRFNQLDRRPIRMTLQMDGFAAEEGLLWPRDRKVWSKRYGTCVSMFRQFNAYKKANGITASYTFDEMLKCYTPDGKQPLYDILLHWTEASAALLVPCTVDEFLEPMPLPSKIDAFFEVSEIADLRRRLAALEDAEKKRARLAATE